MVLRNESMVLYRKVANRCGIINFINLQSRIKNIKQSRARSRDVIALVPALEGGFEAGGLPVLRHGDDDGGVGGALGRVRVQVLPRHFGRVLPLRLANFPAHPDVKLLAHVQQVAVICLKILYVHDIKV